MLDVLVALALLCTVGDWLQTRYIAKHPVEYRELNPILGEHPSTTVVDIYFSICIFLGSGAAYVIPDEAKLIFLLLVTALEAFMVIRNNYLGIKFYD